MPEYLSPGVYVEEVDTGNKPIEGVGTTTVGFVGQTERGPADRPRLLTSFSEYARTFGSYLDASYLTYAVEGFFQNGGLRCFVQRVVSGDATTAASTDTLDGLTIDALGPGVWGDRVAVKISDASLANPALFKLSVIYWAPEVTVPGLDTAGSLVDPTDPANRSDPNRREPTLLEVFDDLSVDPASSSYFGKQVNDRSNLVELSGTPAARPANAGPQFLAGGNDGAAIDPGDYVGDPLAEPGQKTGLEALAEIDEIALLCCPDENNFLPDIRIRDALVQQCEDLKDRFAILQSPETADPVATHRPPTTTRYAAYYYPWLEVRNPRTGLSMNVPPGGHVAGIYNRSDIRVGVHKAPANEPIRGITRLQLQVPKGQQDLLNPRGVNVLRNFPGRGNLVWGARTTSSDSDWKYVNVRRLFIFVEESIEEGTQWVVFENNDEPLWARVRRSVGAFLNRLWLDGMLQGAKAEEAYFVKCDRTTMTQADIDNGRLICLIGIAPVKPAEFVIFRIGQWTGGSEVEEL